MVIFQKNEAELLFAPAIQRTLCQRGMCTVLMTTLLVASREVITFSVHQDECTGESLLQGGWACKPAQETQSTKPGKKRFSLTRGPQNSHRRMSINGAHR